MNTTSALYLLVTKYYISVINDTLFLTVAVLTVLKTALGQACAAVIFPDIICMVLLGVDGSRGQGIDFVKKDHFKIVDKTWDRLHYTGCMAYNPVIMFPYHIVHRMSVKTQLF